RQALLYAWMVARGGQALWAAKTQGGAEAPGGAGAPGGAETANAADAAAARAPRVRAELVLIAIGSDEVEREELPVHLDALEAAVRRRVNALLRAYEAEARRRRERRQAAERLEFPYRELRPGQELILAAVETAV